MDGLCGMRIKLFLKQKSDQSNKGTRREDKNGKFKERVINNINTTEFKSRGRESHWT